MSGYFSEADGGAIARDFPVGEAFETGRARLTPPELRAWQTQQFQGAIARAWEVPFYQRLWGEAGLSPGDIRGLDDLKHVPSFNKQDLMQSVAAYPPFGDYHGRDTASGRHFVLHTTSGTTGAPQPLFFGARDREIQNALLARAYCLQGLRADDVVHSVYGFGMVNGGHYVREALLHFTEATVLSAGTGVETPSEQQVALMARFGVTALVGFGDYLLRLATVAQEVGLVPGKDIPLRFISGHISHELRPELERAWGGVRAFDWYGVGDTGVIAAEGPARDGLICWEDAHYVEIVDPETGALQPEGQPGNLVATVLFKDGIYPIIRFDTNDLSRFVPGDYDFAPAYRRIAGFLGRSDNMIKLRGINVYPTAVGEHLAGLSETNGEYLCRVTRTDGRDTMTVLVEWAAVIDDDATRKVRSHLRTALGVDVQIELMPPGATADATELNRRQKPIRLLDAR